MHLCKWCVTDWLKAYAIGFPGPTEKSNDILWKTQIIEHDLFKMIKTGLDRIVVRMYDLWVQTESPNPGP